VLSTLYLPPRHSAKARLRQSPGSWQSIEKAGRPSDQVTALAVVPVSASGPGRLLASVQAIARLATARQAPQRLSAVRALDLMAMAAHLTLLAQYCPAHPEVSCFEGKWCATRQSPAALGSQGPWNRWKNIVDARKTAGALLV